MAFRRILIKISGEVLGGPQGVGIDQATLERIAGDIAEAAKGVEVAVVVGGGNIVRGAGFSKTYGLDQPTADAMGRLATSINAIALAAAIGGKGRAAVPMSAEPMPTFCPTYYRRDALDHMAAGRVVVLSGGVGTPFFTTDSGAALRAAELGCDAILKGTNVDGVYTADPKKDPSATRYERLTHAEALAKDLKVMDSAAFALARDNALPIIVFSILEPGAIASVLAGTGRATIVAR